MDSVRIGDIIKISKGKKYKLSNSSKLRYLQIDDLRNDSNIKFCEVETKQITCDKNDLLIAWDGANAGTVGYGLTGAIGSTLAKLSFDKNIIETRYFGRFLKSKFIYLKDNCTGATIPHISRDVLCTIQIPLPPLTEQKRIANILDKADALREKNLELLKQYDLLAQSIFLEMFGDPVKNPKGWAWKKIEAIAQVKGRVGWKGYKKTDLRESGPLVLGATHLKDNGLINLKKPVFISRVKFEESPEIMIKNGDVLIVQRGNTIGKIGLVYQDIGEATINPCILIIRPNFDQCTSQFLRHLLINTKINQQFWSLNYSSAQPMITQKDIKSFEIICPPNDMQNNFTKITENIEKQKELAKQSLKESEDLFNALLQKAFNGELN